MRRSLVPFLPLPLLLLLALPSPATAWTPRGQEDIAEDGARLSPPDLYRQLARNRGAYFQGVLDPFSRHGPEYHESNPDGTGELEGVLRQAVANSVQAIRDHKPFNDIAYRLGIVAHYLADANDPLRVDRSDPREAAFRDDYRVYLDSMRGRQRVVFYGFRRDFSHRGAVDALLRETLSRSRRFYPLVGREYRRIGFGSGRRLFDDRSTAFGIGALAYSHAVSDVAEVLRYIWLEAGGTDDRTGMPVRGRGFLLVPRPSDP